MKKHLLDTNICKYIFTIFAILTPFLSSGKQLHTGDDLRIAFKKIAKPYFFAAPAFTDWSEGQGMWLIADQPNPANADVLFLALHDTTLIGIYNNSDSTFMFDSEGNSVLGRPSEYFLLPLWVVKRKAKISSADKAILKLLDELYETGLQSNEGRTDKKAINEYANYKTDTTLANRHIALLFDNYQTLITNSVAGKKEPPSAICVPLMQVLASESISVYNVIPAIVCIYMGEALMSADMTEKAREHFKMSLQFYPDSILILVYNYRLEEDLERKKQMLKELKKKYPQHWMITAL